MKGINGFLPRIVKKRAVEIIIYSPAERYLGESMLKIASKPPKPAPIHVSVGADSELRGERIRMHPGFDGAKAALAGWLNENCDTFDGTQERRRVYILVFVNVLAYAEATLNRADRESIIRSAVAFGENVRENADKYSERERKMEDAAVLLLANLPFAETLLSRFIVERFRGIELDSEKLAAYNEARESLYDGANELRRRFGLDMAAPAERRRSIWSSLKVEIKLPALLSRLRR
jgi:hypothetical protein